MKIHHMFGLAVLSAALIAGTSLFGAVAQDANAEAAAKTALDAIYKGDYKAAFAEKKPELFLKHLAEDFKSVGVEGNVLDVKTLRQFFPARFANQVRLIEHNVTIEDIDVLQNGTVSAVVTLSTLEEFKGANGNYLVTSIGTFRDDWQKRGKDWFELRGTQLRSQTITAPRP